MPIRRIAIAAAFVAGIAALPSTTAKAQYYYPPPCSPFPLAWPFCVAGAIVVTGVTIVTAPFRALAGAPPFYYSYYPQPYYPPPGYPAPGNYGRYYPPR
jgi:hypothetical protein